MPNQSDEGEIQQVSIPPLQEEPASPPFPKKQKKKIQIWMKKRQRINKRLVPSPFVLKTIIEGDEEEEEEELEEEEEQLPLQGRTQLARSTELQRRKSAMGTSPSAQAKPLELSSSEDEVQ